jgi:hypothetical protein
MPFSSMDALINDITSGQYQRSDWNKITGASAYAAGRWYDFSGLGGTPVANAWAGTALAWRTCDETTGNGTQIFGLPNGGNVSPNTKHVLNVSAVTAVATGVPAQLMLVDFRMPIVLGADFRCWCDGAEYCRVVFKHHANLRSYVASDGGYDRICHCGSHQPFRNGGQQLWAVFAFGIRRYGCFHSGVGHV